MIRRRKTGNAIFLAILLTCSAGAIGFSSWLTSSESVNSDINITIGDTVFHDAKNIIKIENIKKLAKKLYSDWSKIGLKLPSKNSWATDWRATPRIWRATPYIPMVEPHSKTTNKTNLTFI